MQWDVQLTYAGLDKAGRDLDEAIPLMLHTFGVRLLANSKLDYILKGRGGTGADGRSWKPNSPATIARKNRRGRNNRRFSAGQNQIGVDTGLQLASASPGFSAPDPKGGISGNVFLETDFSITVGYNRSYSHWFDVERPIFPITMPRSWQDDLEAIAADFGYRATFDGMRRALE